MKIVHDSKYHGSYTKLTFVDADIVDVLATTGWYDCKTNVDAEPWHSGMKRYIWVRVKQQHDPVLICESVSEVRDGGSLTLGGKWMKPKDTTPYLWHMKRIISTTEAWRELIKDFNGKTPSGMTHPRFTAIKDILRRVHALEEKRAKMVETYRKKVKEKVKYKYA